MDQDQQIRVLKRFADEHSVDIARAAKILTDSKVEAELQRIGKILREVGPDLLKEAQDAARLFDSEFRAVLPVNWRQLEDAEVFAALELMQGTGWSLLWTPPGGTVSKIVNATDPQARREALLADESRVLSQLEDLLDSVSDPGLRSIAANVVEALQAYRGGYYKASQALTASLLSTTVHEYLGEDSHKKLRKRIIDPSTHEGPVSDLKLIAVKLAVGKTLEEYRPSTGTPERSDFNRHATSHRVKEPQYRPANALSGLMLLVSFLVELDAFEDQESARDHFDGSN